MSHTLNSRAALRRMTVTVSPIRGDTAFAEKLTRAVPRVFLRTVFSWLRRRKPQRALPLADPRGHLHAPHATCAPGLPDADIIALLMRLHRRVRRLLARRGRPPEDLHGSDPFAAQDRLSPAPSQRPWTAGWPSTPRHRCLAGRSRATVGDGTDSSGPDRGLLKKITARIVEMSQVLRLDGRGADA